MKVPTIRNIPDDFHEIIARIARRNQRSIQQQVISILDRVRILDNETAIEKAIGIRNRLSERQFGNSVDEIREERNR